MRVDIKLHQKSIIGWATFSKLLIPSVILDWPNELVEFTEYILIFWTQWSELLPMIWLFNIYFNLFPVRKQTAIIATSASDKVTLHHIWYVGLSRCFSVVILLSAMNSNTTRDSNLYDSYDWSDFFYVTSHLFMVFLSP